MLKDTSNSSRGGMTYEEKNKALFEQQKNMLGEFLEHGAISKDQYEKSMHDLIEKMGTSSLSNL